MSQFTYYLSKSTENIHKKANVFKDSAILSMNDFERIKQNSQFSFINNSITPIYNSSVNNNTSTNNIQALNLKQIKALALKKKIIEYDKAKTEEAQNAELERYTSLMLHQSKKDKQTEEECLKAMDKLILSAKIATIRDLQVEEKTRLAKAIRKKDEKLEVMMEIERLKELSHNEARDNQLKKQRRDGCRIIIDQIKDNEKVKILQKEMIQKEAIEMIKHIQTLREEDRIKAEEGKKRNERLFNDAVAANKLAIANKQQMQLKEKENEMKIFQYKLEKDKREEELIRETKRLKEEKEREVQKMREVQEKAKDQEEELNFIRARREYEAHERKDRETIAKALSLRSSRLKDFLAMNDQQRLDKEIKRAEQSKEEQIFFDQIVQRQQKELDEEKKLKEDYRNKLYQHNYQLRRQIKDKEERERVSLIEKYEEGMKMKQQNTNYMNNLQEKKKDKIKELTDMNLKPSYLVDLKKFKINQV